MLKSTDTYKYALLNDLASLQEKKEAVKTATENFNTVKKQVNKALSIVENELAEQAKDLKKELTNAKNLIKNN